jgi:L-lysine exporter family protein LysE/ArgO
MSEIIISILHGTFLAFGLIMPLGVQNLFIFNQGSMHSNVTKALPSVIAASLCDTLLIIIAVLGLSMSLMKNPTLKLIILCVGCIFLFYMGVSIWKQSSALAQDKPKHAYSWKKQIIFAMSVSLLNPHAIIDTIMVIGTNSLAYAGATKIAFTATCVIVSWIWFLSMALAGHHLHKLDNNGTWIRTINKIAALIIWIIALGLSVDVVRLFSV